MNYNFLRGSLPKCNNKQFLSACLLWCTKHKAVIVFNVHVSVCVSVNTKTKKTANQKFIYLGINMSYGKP